jgi:hypothetical protein
MLQSALLLFGLFRSHDRHDNRLSAFAWLYERKLLFLYAQAALRKNSIRTRSQTINPGLSFDPSLITRGTVNNQGNRSLNAVRRPE